MSDESTTVEPGSAAATVAAGVGLTRLLRGTAIYGLGSVLNRAVTFLLLPVLTRFLSPGEFGISALLDVACALLVAVFSLGFGSSLTLCYFDGRDAARRLATISTAFWVLAASGVVLGAVAWGGSTTTAAWLLGGGEHAPLMRLALLTAAAMILPQPFSLRLQFEERAGRLVTINLVSTVLVVVFSVVGVVVLERGVRGLWEGRLAAHGLTFLLFAGQFVMRGLARLSRFRVDTARELLRLGLPMVPAFASLFVLLQANRYILSLFRDLDTVGLYSVGVQLGAVMALAISAFSTAWTPYFMGFNDRRDEAPEALSRVMTYYVLGFGGVSLMFYAWARAVLMVMTPPDFHIAYRVTGLAATAQFLIGLFNVLLPPCCFAKEIKFASVVQGIAALLAICFNLILIPRWGMAGAGIALALGPASMVALMWAWNRSQEGRYVTVRYRWRRLSLFALYYVAAAAVLLVEREIALEIEIAVAAAATLTMAAVVWALLARTERVKIVAYAKSLSRSFAARGGAR